LYPYRQYLFPFPFAAQPESKKVEDHLTVLEALQSALSLITDEEELRETIAGTRPGP
jgi:hypothetical protein